MDNKLEEKLKEEKERFDKAKEYLSCDFETGTITWIKKTGKGVRIKIGSIAGNKNIRDTYIVIQFQSKNIRAHRFIYYCYHNELPEFIDHINRIRDDNRILNLRKVTFQENQQNSSIRKDNTSGIRGVRFSKHHNKWAVQMSINKKYKHLGYFDNFEEAVKVRKEAEILYQPFRYQN